MIIIIFSILVVLLLVGCEDKNNKEYCKTLFVDLDSIEADVNDVFSKIEIIPLETTDSSFVVYPKEIQIFEDIIYIYDHDIVKYSRTGNKVYGYCTRVERDIRDNSGFKKEHIISGSGATVDMLSVFYYMRSLNYAKMKKGEEMKLNIFSGKYKELLTIKYLGTVTLEHEGKKHTCYHITFTFTQKGNKKTSDDMWAWISTDAQRIPIKLEGTLAIGKVQCFFTGKN